MKNLLQAIQAVETMDLKVSGEKINQVQRNAIKASIMTAVLADLKEQGVDAVQTVEGIVVRVENETADVFVSLDGSIKNLDFDLQGAIDEFTEKVENRQERERLLAEKREKLAKEKAEKAKKESK